MWAEWWSDGVEKGDDMPNRYVREAAIKSRAVNSLSWQAEVFWRRLINLVDDFGRYSAEADILRADVFPRQLEKVREADMPRLLLECEQAGLLYRFEAGGKLYLVMNQWERGRAKSSKFPAPPEDVGKRLRPFTDANIGLQMSPTPTPTPIPTPTPTKVEQSSAREAVVPSLEEVLTMARMACIPDATAEEFWRHYEANNLWTNRHDKPVNVRQCLVNWAARAARPKPSGAATAPVQLVEGLEVKAL